MVCLWTTSPWQVVFDKAQLLPKASNCLPVAHEPLTRAGNAFAKGKDPEQQEIEFVYIKNNITMIKKSQYNKKIYIL